MVTDRNLLFSGAAAEVEVLGGEGGEKLEASSRRLDDFCVSVNRACANGGVIHADISFPQSFGGLLFDGISGQLVLLRKTGAREEQRKTIDVQRFGIDPSAVKFTPVINRFLLSQLYCSATLDAHVNQ